MKRIEAEAEKWVREFARILPGSLDTTEAVRCYLAGALWMREEAAKVMHPELRSMMSRSQAADVIRSLGEDEVPDA